MAIQNQGLYDSRYEHDACGVGFIAHIRGLKSHKIVSDGLTMLANMEHRGACGCEANTGDGAGIMTQIPHNFFVKKLAAVGCILPSEGEYACASLFFPKSATTKAHCKYLIAQASTLLGLNILHYRIVPADRTDIGLTALSVEPDFEQLFLTYDSKNLDTAAFERKLYIFKNYVTHRIYEDVGQNASPFYFASLSTETIVYKGQLTTHQLSKYYPDLSDPTYESAIAMVHSRFATNTFPSWPLAQPFRYLAHNGEINTLQGNTNWLSAAESSFASELFTEEELKMILPVVRPGQSDSACLDNLIELLVMSGRSLPHVMMMVIPEAWDHDDRMNDKKRAFYEYHASIMEPWDGPAAIAFTDGRMIGATLDRNGLRPMRYCITSQDLVVLASESGVVDIDPATIISQGRLQPGKMFVVDMKRGLVLDDNDLKSEISNRQPYGDWIKKYKIKLEDLSPPRVTFTHLSDESILKYQKGFGYTKEDIEDIILPMALSAKEPIGSMGNDIPLAVLSEKPQHITSYFKQLFAQVTNPPIDPIRERMIMSLSTFVGQIGNLLEEHAEHCHTVALKQPILSSSELEKIRSIDTGVFQAKTLQAYFKADSKSGSMEKALDRLCRYSEDAVNDGFKVIIISDRAIDSEHAAIPSLLATSAVHHHLIKKGLRGKVGIIVETGDTWEVHHFACLLGYGATAVNPYLALATIRNRKANGSLETDLSWSQLKENFIKSICDGLLKVFSKMGISTLQSYQGAQIFEIIGFEKSFVDSFFKGSISRIGGLSADDIAKESLAKHWNAFGHNHAENHLPLGGVYQWRRQGEYHLFNPTTIHLLQYSTQSGNYELYKKYAETINNIETNKCTLRSLLEFKSIKGPISIEDVEPAENIYKRFATGAMSFGSISYEAHTTLAIAMNRLGAKSNTGEGGEDPLRYENNTDDNNLRSSIKQIASGRFGVTSRYLVEADELQIKMAQGAKPGEGGQLPGYKVDDWIGRVRHSTPGVGLISPPPHHDIYSIEDLAQLIFDLKNANHKARINIKLVSKAGVGTIAAGVAKAKADVILIAGHDGGTGASPISSIRHAGLPWELGLAEAQQILVLNGLRNRIVLQADGQMRTGRDIAIATLLGAEEWGVATAALVVEGCIMMRKCHLNTCPVGIATQDAKLRKKFTGQADHVVNFIKFMTQELREIMASLGFRTINEMVGQTQYLTQKNTPDHWKLAKVDLSALLYKDESKGSEEFYNNKSQDHGLVDILDIKLINIAKPAIDNGQKVQASFDVKNTDRTIGTRLSYEITSKYKEKLLPDGTITFDFKGVAGQSFGAFVTSGITLKLEGLANDYVGKGLSGGHLVVRPPSTIKYAAEQNSIIGNVAFYGATGGKAFIRGKAGERFCVRNSGAHVVVEGIGDHGCEYMTGGKVIILGDVGRNFGAGMSGGLAYIFDPHNQAKIEANHEMIDLDPLEASDILYVKEMLEEHFKLTQSSVAKFILSDWMQSCALFTKVYPKDLKAINNKLVKTQQHG